MTNQLVAHEDQIEILASQLHREHRAAEKAMNRVKSIYRAGVKIPNPNRLLHDHGWSSCGKREYFRNRARLVISRSSNLEAQTLGQAERGVTCAGVKASHSSWPFGGEEPMKERPILFSGPMASATFEDRKTQTRRVIQAPRWTVADDVLYMDEVDPPWPHAISGYSGCMARVECPYGAPGDRLWVKEEHYRYGHWEQVPGVKTKTGRMKWRFVPDTTQIIFDAKEYGLEERFGPVRKGRHHKDPSTMAWHKRIARFMPKSASRITLEITDVRVQRLQEISESDAIAEGIEKRGEFPNITPWTNYQAPKGCPGAMHFSTPMRSFQSLWDSINADRGYGWGTNPWVWALTFRRLA